MDPHHILVLDNGCEQFTYKRILNVWADHFDLPKVDLLTWTRKKVKVFYMHNTSKDIAHEDFSVTLMADLVNVIENQYDSDLGNEGITYYKSLNDVDGKLPILLMSAVGVIQCKYVDLLVNRVEKEEFVLNEFPVVKIHSDEQIIDLLKNIKSLTPPNCSHILFNFIFRYKDEGMKSHETVIFHYIESLTTNYIKEVKPDKLDHLLQDVKKIFKDLEINAEHMAFILFMDKTTSLEESEHIFEFFRIKIPEDVLLNRKLFQLSSLHIDNNSALVDKLVEVMSENTQLKVKVCQIEANCKELSQKIDKNNKAKYKSTITKELIDRLNTSYNDRLESQRVKFEEMHICEEENYELKLESVERFYKNLIENLKKDLKTERVTVNPMQDVTPRPAPRTTTEDLTQDSETTRLYKSQIQDLQLKSDQLTEEIIQKQNTVDSLILQVQYYKFSKDESEKTKQQLEAENAEILRTLENFQTRHTEQFQIYEKLLAKSRKEIEVHKREVSRLREHLSSENSPQRLLLNPRTAAGSRRFPFTKGIGVKMSPPPDEESATGNRRHPLPRIMGCGCPYNKEITAMKMPPPPPAEDLVNRRHPIAGMRRCTNKEPETTTVTIPTPPPPPELVGSTNGLLLRPTPPSKPAKNEENDDVPLLSKWLRSAEKAAHDLTTQIFSSTQPLNLPKATSTPKSNSEEPACIKWLRSMEKYDNETSNNKSDEIVDVETISEGETPVVSKTEQPKKQRKRGRPKKKHSRKK